MSLGVLNNLSAIYAENNLNNSNNSLNTVLQQLSSGSKINSGADDAAGLSLVNGLQANQQALTQSITNATEGVGLLQVADGALSQVTSLLNRAVTLATEAANGTLNSSQDTAANQEYQSILSEISNIGTTTTYNGAAVFNTSTNIYTGDSSTVGSSIDALDIRTLSSSNVGDSGGIMAYSNGSDNVFLNLSSSTANAALTDTLNGSGTTTLNINYLVKGNGTESTATTSLTVGTGNFANTVGGLISAINNSGLGLTASFATQAQAGVQGGGTQTGIQITGGLISAGVAPSESSTSGTLDLSGLAPGATLALGATVTVNQGSNSHVFTIDSTNNTLANLATAISAVGALGVTASVVTNGDGTQSLALADTGPTGGALSVTTTAATAQVPEFNTVTPDTVGSTVQLNGTNAAANVSGSAYIASVPSAIIVGTGGTDAETEQLTEGTSITIRNSIANDTQVQTFVVGNGTDINTSTGTHYTGATVDGGTGGNTLGNLADAINAQSGTLGVYASIGASGLTITTGTFISGNYATSGTGTVVLATPTTLTGQNVSVTANNLTSATASTELGLYTPTLGGAAGGGSPTITDLDSHGNPALLTDVLSGSITLNDPQNSGGAVTFTMNGTTDTWATLRDAINASTLGVSASWGAALGGAGDGGLQLTATSNGINTVTVSANTLADTVGGPFAVAKDALGTGIQPGVAGQTVATPSTAILQLASGNIIDTGGSASVLGGAVSITYGAVPATQVFIMGTDPGAGSSLHVANAIYTGGTSVTSLIDAINSVAMGGVTNALNAKGVTASENSGGGGTGGIFLTGAVGVASPFTLNTIVPTLGVETPLAVTTAITDSGTPTGTGSTAVTGQAGNNAVHTVTAAIPVSTSDTLGSTGSVADISIKNSAGGITDTFIVGTGTNVPSSHEYYTNSYGNTLAGLAAAINALSDNNVSAQANTSGLTLTQTGTTGTYTGGAISITGNTLTDATKGTYSTSTSSQLANENDTMSGALVFSVGSSGATQTVNMSDVTGAGDAGTVAGMIKYINDNASTLGISAAWVPAGGGSTFGAIQLTSGTEGSSLTADTVDVSSTLTSLVDTTTGAALSYTANRANDMELSGSITDSTTTAAATFASDSKASSGIATISYTDAAGVSLSSSDLLNQTNAQASLTKLNAAITAVAAQDGYIGAQINTLNAVSQVLSTQSENVKSAQNAVQATDYAAATSNMSKYEILSQTGIAALAQANSVQQEVLKLI